MTVSVTGKTGVKQRAKRKRADDDWSHDAAHGVQGRKRMGGRERMTHVHGIKDRPQLLNLGLHCLAELVWVLALVGDVVRLQGPGVRPSAGRAGTGGGGGAEGLGKSHGPSSRASWTLTCPRSQNRRRPRPHRRQQHRRQTLEDQAQQGGRGEGAVSAAARVPRDADVTSEVGRQREGGEAEGTGYRDSPHTPSRKR